MYHSVASPEELTLNTNGRKFIVICVEVRSDSVGTYTLVANIDKEEFFRYVGNAGSGGRSFNDILVHIPEKSLIKDSINITLTSSGTYRETKRLNADMTCEYSFSSQIVSYR